MGFKDWCWEERQDVGVLVQVPCLGDERGGFHLGLAELEGLVGQVGRDVSRKVAGEMWEGERAQDRVREG